MPELRRSTRASTAEATKRLEQPPSKKVKTDASTEETKLKNQEVQEPKESSETKKEDTSKGDKPTELEIGDEIPDLTLLNENEEEVSLKKVAANSKYMVIFSYPKASTPGCTKQANGFQRNYSALQALGTAVYGLSADLPKSQLNFVTKQGLEYPLLSDPSRNLISILGAKKHPSGVKRSHWIFVDGKLAVKQIQISPDVSVDSALEDVRKLKEESGSGDAKPEDAEDTDAKTEEKED